MSTDHLKLELDVEVAAHGEQHLVDVRKEMGRLAHEIQEVAAGFKGLMSNTGNLSGITSSIRKAKADALSGEGDALQALKRRLAFEGKMGRQKSRQQAQETRDARQQVAEDERRFKALFDFNSRMQVARERSAKSAAAAALKADKDQAKARGASIKEAAQQAKRAADDRAKAEADAERKVRQERRETADQLTRQRREHEKAMDRAQRGAGQVRQGVGQVAGYGGAAAGALGYGTARVVSRGVSTRMDIDSAETAIKMFNDTDDGRGGRRAITDADIKQLRRGPGGLDSEAIRNGVSISEALRVYNEASKAGLQDPMAQTRTILSAGSALELNPQAITSLFGVMGRNMGAAATPGRSKSVANAIAVAAREDPTQANEIVEGMRRAQSVLAMTKGVTEEDLAGMVSGGISAGIQPGKAGTHISSIAKSISEGNNKFLDPKKRKELNFAASRLGFGSAKNMAGQFSGENGKAVIYQVLEKLKGMTPDMRSRVAEALSGGQWSDETLQVVNGLDGMKHTDAEIHDPKNANFLDDSRNKRMQSWKGLWDQSQAIFSLFWESFGSGFDGILRDVNSFFLDLNGKFQYDQITDIVRDSLDGLKKGLGFASWKEALASIVPTDVRSMGPAIRDFATGFGSGIRSVADTIKGVASFFGGGDGAENMGRLAGKFLLLSSAALALTPVLGVITGISSIALGLLGMARAAGTFIGARAAGTGAMAGIARGAASLAGWPAIGVAIGSALIDYITPRLGDWLRSRLGPGFLSNTVTSGQRAITGGENFVGSASTWLLDLFRDRPGHAVGGYVSGPGGPTSDSVMARLSNGEFVVNAAAAARHGGLLEAINSGQTPGFALGGSVGIGNSSGGYVSPFASTRASDDMRALASAISDLVRVLRFESGSRTTRARNLRYGIGGGAGGGAGAAGGGGGDGGTVPAVEGSTPGGALPSTGMRQRGVMGGGGSASSNPANSAASARMLDAIAGTESGQAGYDAVLGNGRYGTPSKPVSTMTLDEAFAFGRQVRARHGSSSALGRYQIVGNTMRAAQRALNIPGDAVFDPAMQDRMARWIARNQGLGAWQGLRRNPAAMAQAQAALAQGGAADAPVASAGGSGGGGGPPQVGNGSGRSQPHIEGQLQMEGQSYDFGSGGHRGANSIPAGTYPITPGTIGPWGQRNNAIGINNNAIYDRTLGRMRTGIEFHAASSARKLSAGCIAIARGQYGRFRAHVMDVIRRQGSAYLTVDESGRASITSGAEAAQAATAQTRRLGQRAGAVETPPAAQNREGPVSLQTPLGQDTPTRGSNTGGSGGISGSGHTFNQNVTVNGANKSPQEIAAAVQLQLQDGMNRRTHDYDGFS